jgi:hypothetical protein
MGGTGHDARTKGSGPGGNLPGVPGAPQADRGIVP